MAETVIMTKKLERVDIIKTICSHGWFINGMIMDDVADVQKKHNEIINAKIRVYSINARIKSKRTLVLYQPDLNEMTFIANNREIENDLKNKIGDILEKQKLGPLYKNIDPYINNLCTHINFLTDKEFDALIGEVEKQRSDHLNYIH